MKSLRDYQAERKKQAAYLAVYNEQACRIVAQTLHRWEEYAALCALVQEPPRIQLPIAYFDALYRILCFGPIATRARVLLGGKDEIESVVSTVQREHGFYDDNGKWWDV